MTSQPSDIPASAPTGPAETPAGSVPADDPGGTEEKTARQFTDPLRQPAAFVLLVANGLILLFAITDLFVIMEDWPTNFVTRAGGSFVDFVGIMSIGFPLLAVLLATHVKPRVPQARLITAIALVEYGVSALFGALCLLVDFLHGVADSQLTLGISPARRAFEDLLVRAGEFALLAVAAFAVFQLFQGLYAGARPIAAPLFYGGHPPAYGQPGYPPAYGQPGYPPAYGQPGYPPAYGQPTYPAGFQPYGQHSPGFGGPPSGWGGQAPYRAQPAHYGPQPAQGTDPAYGPQPAQGTDPAYGPQPAQGTDAAHEAHSEPGPVAGDQAGPTEPIRRPGDPEGPSEQWMRP